ncbi:zinc-dependent alcohol dehydrogenase [Secundilactobacillus mixtipabuli]|uniref:Alcohol dehydrogenase n=1 Tax=Secundilactobacillus mixtipabuli TaxID=1435342 RepID=A0A1Z5IAR6_9LACO|nr:alcohol dehydrogenase catalytic domain-containing protein [Secundilactobacillus mixtipabuli]GAW98717.1 alcohol dehydrogenase [Secundilactobacillus mixtipabuli]
MTKTSEKFKIPETMKAAVLFGPGDMRVVDKPVPTPASDQVLVKVAECGMCGTDLKIYDGHFPLTPPFGKFTPGHEWTGTIVGLGDSVDEFEIGDRVCIEAHHGCGRCENCLAGKYTMCLNYGNPEKGQWASGMTADGGFAEYVVHSVSSVYKMNDSLTFDDAVVLTTAGTGLFGIDTIGGYLLGEDVLIFGGGPVGLMTVQLAKQLGAKKVILADLIQSRLDLGKKLGADYVINSGEVKDVPKKVKELTGGEGVHVAIDAAGATMIPQQLIEATRRGGQILLIAFYGKPVTLDLASAIRQGIQIHTSRGEGGGNVARAVSLAEMGRLTCGELVTNRFPLEKINEALGIVRSHEGDPIKVVIQF